MPAGLRGRLLTAADTPALATLRHTVISCQLEDPNCYRLKAEGPDFPANHLGPNGMGEKGLIAGLLDAEGALIAYGALSLLAPGEPGRADVLSLSPAQRERMGYLASAMVRADWRGQGLHHFLIEWRLTLAGFLRCRHLVSAVWPGNHLSWGHLVAHGLPAKKLAQFESGLERLVLHRNLEDPPQQPAQVSRILIRLDQLAALERHFDEGYWLWRRILLADGIYGEMAPPRPGGA